MRMDPDLNDNHALIISKPVSPVTARVTQNNEELMIARHSRRLIIASLDVGELPLAAALA